MIAGLEDAGTESWDLAELDVPKVGESLGSPHCWNHDMNVGFPG